MLLRQTLISYNILLSELYLNAFFYLFLVKERVKRKRVAVGVKDGCDRRFCHIANTVFVRAEGTGHDGKAQRPV